MDQIDCYQNIGTKLTMNSKCKTKMVFSSIKKKQRMLEIGMTFTCVVVVEAQKTKNLNDRKKLKRQIEKET